jgi:predicted permease
MDWLRHDLKYAVRALGRRPGFTALAVFTLAAGLGVNTVAFSAVNALLYKPFRFANADVAGWLFVGTSRDPLNESSIATFEAIKRGATTLDYVAGQGRVPLAFKDGGLTREVWSLVVSADYFSIVAVQPVRGRTLTATDGSGSEVSVLVSERFWNRQLASRELSGLTVHVNGRDAAVVGVIPDDHQGPGGLFEPDLWVPLEARRALALPARLEAKDNTWLGLLAKPRTGTTTAAIQGEVSALAAPTMTLPPGEEMRVSYTRFVERHPEVRSLSPVAAIGMVAVGMVLLIACFNVASLILARAIERRRELSVRAALGASRWRLSRQILTEALVLAVAGGAAALVLASWSATLLGTFSLPAPIPQRLHFVTDARLIAFSIGAALLAAVVPALAPVWHIARADLARWVRVAGTSDAGAFGQRRTRRVFVTLQIAGSTLFLGCALITAQRFFTAWQLDPGFNIADTAVLTLDPVQYGRSPERARELAETIAARVRSTPAIAAVTIADRMPFYVGAFRSRQISKDGHPCADGGCVTAGVYAIDGRYFETMETPVVAGRTIDPDNASDVQGSAVISEAAAAVLWPGESPIGRRFKDDTAGDWREVVGVVRDITHRAPDEAKRPYLYLPLTTANTGGDLVIVARAQAGRGSAAALPALREAVQAVDATLPIQSLQTMDERMALPMWLPRTMTGFFGVCGALAVLLSTIGLFGVTHYTVSRRGREFGVRAALGATSRDMRRLVFGETLRLAGPGVVLGAVAIVTVVAIARATLPSVPVIGIAPYLTAIAIQTVVTLLASWSPARRAGTSDPLEILRQE